MVSKQELQRRFAIAGFLLPGGLLFALLVLNPLVQAFILSTYRWVTLSRRVFVGFENYLAEMDGLSGEQFADNDLMTALAEKYDSWT